MSADSRTWVACLTPPGHGALATVGLHGASAWEAARQLFRTRGGAELPVQPRVGKFWLGRMGKEIADEVVLAVKRLEPVPSLEVHCHGGREAVRLLIDHLQFHGLHLCGWPEFLRVTDGDPLKTAATIALAHATTARTAEILLEQQNGVFREALDAVLTALETSDFARGESLLKSLSRFSPVGRHLTTPLQLAIAGAPNVGKSSLINALAGYQRSVVAPTPGTTRDVVTLALAIDGWPVEVADTAGIREKAEYIEKAGIRKAQATVASADLCLWVVDAGSQPVWPDSTWKNVILVINKIDLPPDWSLDLAAGAVRVSAKTGDGIPALCEAISRCLVPDSPAPGTPVPFTDKLCTGIDESLNHCESGNPDRALEVLKQMRGHRESIN